MIKTALKGKRVILEPLEDLEYFLNLADLDNKYQYPREEIKAMIEKEGQEFWTIMIDGTRRGVVGYFKFNDVYALEALKDHSQPLTGITVSIEVGNLVLDYMFQFTNKVRTCARVSEKAIQILCKKLGFKEINRINNLVIYEKEAETCQYLQR
jgi:hypothetical protein